MGIWSALFGGGSSGQRIVELHGDGYFEFEIVGESRYQPALEQICGGRDDDSAEHVCVARLVPEPSNPYDQNAVRVDIDGHVIGYLPRQDAADYGLQLQGLGLRGRTAACHAVIVGGWDRGERGRGHFGVKLDIVWPIQVAGR